MNCEGNIT